MRMLTDVLDDCQRENRRLEDALTAAQGEIAVQAERARCFQEEREIAQAALEQAEAERERLKDAAEMLWVVLANVSGGDWTKQTADWQEYAARWRDNYFAALSTPARPTEEPCSCGSENPKSARHGRDHLAWCLAKSRPSEDPQG